MKCNLPYWNLRKCEGKCTERGLHVVRNGEGVVERGVDQLDGEVGRICGGSRPRDRYCTSSRPTTDGVDGQSRDKGESERERARQPN